MLMVSSVILNVAPLLSLPKTFLLCGLGQIRYGDTHLYNAHKNTYTPIHVFTVIRTSI